MSDRLRWIRCLCIGVALLLCAAVTHANTASTPTFAPKSTGDDSNTQHLYGKRVDEAIAKAQEYLFSKQNKDGSWDEFKAWGHKYPVGPTAMITYALLESGVSPQDSRLKKALYWLVEADTDQTYELAFRASAYRAAMKSTKGLYRKPLRRDMAVLVRGSIRGAYGYHAPPSKERLKKKKYVWDHSNSQYGLLGVWAGLLANEEVPRGYWQMVMDHWRKNQKPDGGWGYRPDLNWKSSPAMTAAGLASLFVCYDNLYVNQFVHCKGNTEFPPIQRGLDYFQKNFQKDGGAKFFYHVYGVERVGLACGYKYFGKTDWYKWGLEEILEKQRNDGGWKSKGNHSGNDETASAYALLFLIRGRNPVLFNKLQYDGDWNNRPRDAASVTRWISDKTERTVAWQIIKLAVPVEEWHDAPILYIAGSKEPTFTDEEIQKLREYVLQGGTILSATECNGPGFRKGIRKAYAKMFPKYELTPMAPDHPIYSVYHQLRGKPKLFRISNGVRPFVIHTDEDMPLSWQMQRVSSQSRHFEAAANIYMYVTDLGTLHNRGVTYWPEKPKRTPGKTVKLARLKHSGNDDPEPYAFKRFTRLMAKHNHAKVELDGPMAISSLSQKSPDIVTLTGTGSFSLTEEEQAALKKYVDGGGTLFVNSLGGNEAFADAARKTLRSMYPNTPLLRTLRSSDLYNMEGLAIREVSYRPYRKGSNRQNRTYKTPRLRSLTIDGRDAVIFSEIDVVEGLLGIPIFEADGYTPASAFELMRNIVLYAEKH
ncbi:MAG: DUF4159 domain-containing protein [Phycisphaerae bacterium]